MAKKSQTAARKLAAPAKKVQTGAWALLAIAAGLVVIVIAAALLNQSAPADTAALPAEISVAQAYAKYQDGVLLLDVRTQEEWDEYHAPDTAFIPLDELPNRLAELPKDQEIVVVCRSGNRSQAGRDILLEAGFANVTSMAGGLSAWRSAGYPIEP